MPDLPKQDLPMIAKFNTEVLKIEDVAKPEEATSDKFSKALQASKPNENGGAA
jgi:hypothetical protein